MKLIIDLTNNPSLVIKQGQKKIAEHSWQGLYQLSETLLDHLDKILKANNLELQQIEEIKVKPSKQSIVSTRIAKAIALALKIKV